MQALLSLGDQYEVFLIALILTIPRVYAFMDSSQFLSATAVPGMTRIGAMLTLALLISPANLTYARQATPSVAALALFFGKEYAIGVTLGYFVGWVFWVVQTAGAFIDNQRGAAIASSIDPLLGAESSPLGDMFALVFLTYIFAAGGILQIIGLLFESYAIWPISRQWPTLGPEFPRLALGIFDYAMRLGFDIAAPVIAVMFIAEFSLALVGRFAPQIQVFILAMPIKSLLAVFMLIFYSVYLFPYASRQVGSAAGFIDRFYAAVGLTHDSIRSAPDVFERVAP